MSDAPFDAFVKELFDWYLEWDPVGATSLGAALARTGALARQRGLVVVVSDFRGPLDWRTPLLELMSRHEVLAVEVRDPREQELPDVGELWLVDPETGRQVRVDTSSAALRSRFAAAARERGLLVLAFGSRTIRAVTHLDVSQENYASATDLRLDIVNQ